VNGTGIIGWLVVLFNWGHPDIQVVGALLVIAGAVLEMKDRVGAAVDK
jgi:hypothetical protein